MKKLNPDEKAAQTIEALTPHASEVWQAAEKLQKTAHQVTDIIYDPDMPEAEKMARVYDLIKERPE